MAENSGSKLLTLELGRGIAAILVVLFHVSEYYFASPRYWSEPLFGGLFAFGRAGVMFFFVLSGFIMIWAHYGDLGRPGAIASFARKRFVRIYPLAMATVLVTAALFALAPGSGTPESRDPLVLLQSLALFGVEPLDAINFPTWTLWHENLFYLFCALIIALPRIGLAALIAWAAACLVAGLLASSNESLFYFWRPNNSLFALGVGCAFLLKRRATPVPGLVLAAGVVLFFGFGLYDNGHDAPRLFDVAAYGIASAMVVLGGVELDRRGALRLPQWSALFGTLSYPLYLTHMITLAILAKAMAMAGLPRILPGPAAAALLLAASVAAAQATHVFYEKPVTRALRNYLRRRDGTRAALRSANT